MKITSCQCPLTCVTLFTWVRLYALDLEVGFAVDGKSNIWFVLKIGLLNNSYVLEKCFLESIQQFLFLGKILFNLSLDYQRPPKPPSCAAKTAKRYQQTYWTMKVKTQRSDGAVQKGRGTLISQVTSDLCENEVKKELSSHTELMNQHQTTVWFLPSFRKETMSSNLISIDQTSASIVETFSKTSQTLSSEAVLLHFYRITY